MSFKVELSELASMQYDKFLGYIYFVLKNSQAADNLMQDFDETIEILEEQANHFGYCRFVFYCCVRYRHKQVDRKRATCKTNGSNV